MYNNNTIYVIICFAVYKWLLLDCANNSLSRSFSSFTSALFKILLLLICNMTDCDSVVCNASVINMLTIVCKCASVCVNVKVCVYIFVHLVCSVFVSFYYNYSVSAVYICIVCIVVLWCVVCMRCTITIFTIKSAFMIAVIEYVY